MWQVWSRAGHNFFEDECPRLAASLAYYTFFSLPALLVTIVFIAGTFLNNAGAVQTRLKQHFEETIGTTGAEQLTAMLQNASAPSSSWPGWLIGSIMLVVGATGALAELQTALNRAWGVSPDAVQGGLKRLLMKRLLSLALLIVIALLLCTSLVVSWALEAFGHWIDSEQLSWLPTSTMSVLHSLASLAIIAMLFATVVKFLPDAKVDWTDVWWGALLTAILFGAGQWLLGVYLSWSRPTSAYGAAGALALVLLWIYYSALILFFGVEFTQALAERRGQGTRPNARNSSRARSLNGVDRDDSRLDSGSHLAGG